MGEQGTEGIRGAQREGAVGMGGYQTTRRNNLPSAMKNTFHLKILFHIMIHFLLPDIFNIFDISFLIVSPVTGCLVGYISILSSTAAINFSW